MSRKNRYLNISVYLYKGNLLVMVNTSSFKLLRISSLSLFFNAFDIIFPILIKSFLLYLFSHFKTNGVIYAVNIPDNK